VAKPTMDPLAFLRKAAAAHAGDRTPRRRRRAPRATRAGAAPPSGAHREPAHGHLRLWSVNQQSPLVPPARDVLRQTAGVAERLRGALSGMYVSVADPLTLREVEGRADRAVISLAARVGPARLSDNVLLGMTLEELSAA